MKKLKSFAAIVTMLACLLMLVSCSYGKELKELYAVQLVTKNIDAVYKGEGLADFAKIVVSTEAKLEAVYQEAVCFGAESLAFYWGVLVEDETLDDLDAALAEEMKDLSREIMSRIKFEEQGCETVRGGWEVKLVIHPVNVNEKANDMYINDESPSLTEYFEKYDGIGFPEKGSEEYWNHTNDYGWAIAGLLREALEITGYNDPVEMTVFVEEGDYVHINQEDWEQVGLLLISYPYE